MQSFYASVYQQPLLLWALSVPFLVYLLMSGLKQVRSPFLQRHLLIFSVLTIVDAWLSANHVYGLGALPGWLAQPLVITLVLLGDLRYFLVLTRMENTTRKRWFASAVGLMFIVPVASRLFPETNEMQLIFLRYELLFLVIASAIQWIWRPKAKLRRITAFVQLYYVLWAVSDILILKQAGDWAWGLRVIPNVLYYAGLMPLIFVTLKEEKL